MYMQYQPGIASDEDYPYQENVKHAGTYPCRYNSSTSIGATRGYARVKADNETLLKDVVAAVGPVAFAFNASLDSFLFYKNGIYDEPDCAPSFHHSAVIVGYGTQRYKSGKSVDYWLCKNSW